MPEQYQYVGGELGLFAKAVNWKEYWLSRVAPWVSGSVLEVGAGIGANTGLLLKIPALEKLTSLEPDSDMAQALARAVADNSWPVEVRTGTLTAISLEEKFDSILYIDVLEHIEDDAGELARAGTRLKQGGRLVVLSPALPFLYSPFDREIGHFRRYTKKMLREITPTDLRLANIAYLDSVGLLASLGNRLLLHKPMPSETDIRLWDSVFVPASRLLDRLTFSQIGKSILSVWEKV
jgi:SAM-dependent methyltransferase